MIEWKKFKYNFEVSVLNISRKFLLVRMLRGPEKKNVSSIYVASKKMQPHQE